MSVPVYRIDTAIGTENGGRLRQLGVIVHGVLGWTIYLIWSGVLAVLLIICAVFGASDRTVCSVMRASWGQWLWWFNPFWWRQWEGLEHMGPGPYVIVSNHQSTVDIPCLHGLPVPIRVATRPGIFRVKLLGAFVRMSRQINTDHFFEEGRKALAGGRSILVFAEGTRSVDGQVGRFKRGAFQLALETETPILPIALEGTRHIMAKRKYLPSAPIGRVRIRILPPQAVPEHGDDRRWAQEVRAEIAGVVHAMQTHKEVLPG